MELPHPLMLQEAAKEGEALAPCARAMQDRARAHVAATGQEVGKPVGSKGSPLVLGAGGYYQHSQSHGVQPPFPLRTCGYGPDGLVPGEITSTREELPSAETCCLFGALGSGLAWAPCGKGSRERGEEQLCRRRGVGAFLSPAHISAVVIHMSVTGTSVQRERSNTGPAERQNCFQGC